MEKETKHTPGEDEQNGPYIFTGGADRISSTVTFEKGHERSLILRKHLSEDRIDNQSIRYKVYDAMEDYKNYELTIASTELSEMKKEREELIKKLSSTRVKDKNGVEIFDGDRVKERLIDFEKDGGYIDVYYTVRWGKWCYCLFIHDKYCAPLDTPKANNIEVVKTLPN